MREVVIELLQRGKSTRLSPGPNNVTLTEGDALISVSGSRAPIYLNDLLLNLHSVDGGIRVGTLDLLNRPGMYRISVHSALSNIHFDFATMTAKAAWEEVEAMIEATRQYSLGDGRPFIYLGADGMQRAESLEKVMFWLRDRLRELSQLARLIDKVPAVRMQPQLRTTSRARGMDLRATAALLRERPELMEEVEGGGVVFGEKKFWPSLVRVRSTDASLPQVEHRQLRTLLARLLSICRSVVPVLPEVGNFIPELAGLLQLRTLGVHLSGPGDAYPRISESVVERRDSRYRRLRELEREFQLKFSHLKDPAVLIRAGLKDVWEIYQAFAAHTVGRVLGLDYVSGRGDLRVRDSNGVSMAGHGLRLFYDVQVPGEYLPSWRSASVRPAFERPDIVIIDEVNKRALVVDVKFSIDNDGQCRSAHLFEMQGYLNSYGLQAAAILFPGQPSAAREVSSGSYSLAEIPLRADTILSSGSASLDQLRERLERLWNRIPI